MIRLSANLRDNDTKLPIHKREFINWFLNISKEKSNYPQNYRLEIESISYAYYKHGYYWKLNSYNIIRALLACMDLSVHWHEHMFQHNDHEYRNYSLNPKIQKNRLYLTQFSFRFVSYLRDDTNLLWEIDSFINEVLAERKVSSQEEIFDVVCENYSRELIREFETFCEVNPNYRYQISSSYGTHRLADLPSKVVLDIFTTVTNQSKHLDTSTRMDLLVKTASLSRVSLYSSDFEGYYHVFNFFGQLKKREVSNLTKKEVIKEIDKYCSNPKIKIIKNLKRILFNCYFGNKSIFKEISSIFDKTEINDLSYVKYQKAYCHCIILFENDNDFKRAFLDNGFDKIDSATLDILNVYYCEQDVKGKLSGYNTINKFEKEGGINISEESLPAIMIWLEDINKFELINLFDLDFTRCFYIIRKLKATIKEEIKQNNNISIQEKNDIFLRSIEVSRKEVTILREEQKELLSRDNYFHGPIEMLQQNIGSATGKQIKNVLSE